jgi:hypothetical protein
MQGGDASFLSDILLNGGDGQLGCCNKQIISKTLHNSLMQYYFLATFFFIR